MNKKCNPSCSLRIPNSKHNLYMKISLILSHVTFETSHNKFYSALSHNKLTWNLSIIVTSVRHTLALSSSGIIVPKSVSCSSMSFFRRCISLLTFWSLFLNSGISFSFKSIMFFLNRKHTSKSNLANIFPLFGLRFCIFGKNTTQVIYLSWASYQWLYSVTLSYYWQCKSYFMKTVPGTFLTVKLYLPLLLENIFIRAMLTMYKYSASQISAYICIHW